MSAPIQPACVEAAETRPDGNPDWACHLLDASAHLSRARDALFGVDDELRRDVNTLVLVTMGWAIRDRGPR